MLPRKQEPGQKLTMREGSILNGLQNNGYLSSYLNTLRSVALSPWNGVLPVPDKIAFGPTVCCQDHPNARVPHFLEFQYIFVFTALLKLSKCGILSKRAFKPKLQVSAGKTKQKGKGKKKIIKADIKVGSIISLFSGAIWPTKILNGLITGFNN